MAFTHKEFVVRTNIIWIGPSEDVAEFANRQLSIKVADPTAAIGDLPFASAIIFNVVEANRGRLVDNLRLLAEPALNHGLTIHIMAETDATQLHVYHVTKSLAINDRVRLWTKPPLHFIAEAIARHEPGPFHNGDLTIGGEKLSAIAELLLRRAFCDCTKIIVSPLDRGMTSDVLSVHAVFKDSLSGPRPLPFFAKVGERSSIQREQQNYVHYVEHFVPFYLRPSLDYDRCVFGFEQAVLVGNFVEYSEPLGDVARRHIAQASIHSLFDHALRGWRLQAKEVTCNLLSAMPWFVIPDQIPKNRIVQAYECGASRSPEEIEALLRSLPAVAYLCAPYHGDLHAANVRVRGSDAILIDFQRISFGPLLADHACLEVSLAFNEYKGDSNEGWSSLIETLYLPDHFRHPPRPSLEPAPREWLWNAVRQIRTIALTNQLSSEYLQIVAISLLRFARLPARSTDTPIAEFRKAFAYCVAEKLITYAVGNA